MEKLLKKLKKLLKKAGVEDEKVEKIVAELESDDDPGEPTPDAPTDEEHNEPIQEELPPEEPPLPDDPGDVPPPEEVPPLPPEDAPVPPVEEQLPPAEEVPPVEPPVPPMASGIDIEGIMSAMEELKSALAEKDAVIEGLSQKVDSLAEALKTSGVIQDDGATPEVKPTAPANPVQETGGLDDFLAQINAGTVTY